MHEFSVMSQIFQSVMEEAKRRNASRIEEVDLEIGEFTMLGDEQMRFSFEVLAKDTIMEGAKLNIRPLKGRISCACGYEGGVKIDENSPHRAMPILECPKCGAGAKVTEGRECVVRNIRMVVPDV